MIVIDQEYLDQFLRDTTGGGDSMSFSYMLGQCGRTTDDWVEAYYIYYMKDGLDFEFVFNDGHPNSWHYFKTERGWWKHENIPDDEVKILTGIDDIYNIGK